MKLSAQDKWEILETAATWVVVMAMLVYGFGKWIQFEGAAEIDKTVQELSGMELMWAFYGYSRSFVLSIGMLEITGAILLFFRSTRLLGCLFTSTILINVILQDFFYEVNQGALKAAILYQLLIVFILFLHRDKLLKGLQLLLIKPLEKPNRRRFFLKASLAFALFCLLRMAEYFITTGA
jgi:hypothetical protein